MCTRGGGRRARRERGPGADLARCRRWRPGNICEIQHGGDALWRLAWVLKISKDSKNALVVLTYNNQTVVAEVAQMRFPLRPFDAELVRETTGALEHLKMRGLRGSYPRRA